MATSFSAVRAEALAAFGQRHVEALDDLDLYLADAPPWEVINRQLPAQQKRLVKVEDFTASSVVGAYGDARRKLSEELTALHRRYFSGPTPPTPGQLARFVRGAEVMGVLSYREAELLSTTTRQLEGGLSDAVAQATISARLQLQAMGNQYPGVTQGEAFAPPPGIAEEVGIANAVSDITALPAATMQAVTRELVAGALLGEGMDKLRGRLRAPLAASGLSAELTARYAVMRAHNVAAEVHYGDVQTRLARFGRVVSKVWVTSIDDRACPICLALHGEVVAHDGRFDPELTFSTSTAPEPWPSVASLTVPPRHARCRCTIIPWVNGWRGGTLLTPEAMKAQARAWAQEHGLVTVAIPRTPNPSAGIVGTPKVLSGGRIPSTLVRSLPDEAYRAAVQGFLTCATGSPTLKGPAGASSAAEGALRGSL